jgi:hypothetical protein
VDRSDWGSEFGATLQFLLNTEAPSNLPLRASREDPIYPPSGRYIPPWLNVGTGTSDGTLLVPHSCKRHLSMDRTRKVNCGTRTLYMFVF